MGSGWFSDEVTGNFSLKLTGGKLMVREGQEFVQGQGGWIQPLVGIRMGVSL
jgi:hypothetical protein